MVSLDSRPMELYFYRAMSASPQHRNRVSAYLVERFTDSTVVARIEPLGLVHSVIGEQELALQRVRRNLVVSSPWERTPSRHHARMRVVPITARKE